MKLILKHSFRCPISARAKGEVDRFLAKYEEKDKLDFELVDVIDNRQRSAEIVEQTGIRHESPQALLFDDDNKLIWFASHRDITRENLSEAIKK